jgi:hypothetical protein
MKNFKLVLTPESVIDIKESYNWYNDKSSELGERFFLSVSGSLKSILRAPIQYPKYSKEIRRCLIKRFPFAIFYFIYKNEIVIIAVMHLKREPNKWQNRIN